MNSTEEYASRVIVRPGHETRASMQVRYEIGRKLAELLTHGDTYAVRVYLEAGEDHLFGTDRPPERWVAGRLTISRVNVEPVHLRMYSVEDMPPMKLAKTATREVWDRFKRRVLFWRR